MNPSKKGNLKIVHLKDKDEYQFIINLESGLNMDKSGYGSEGAAASAGKHTARSYGIDLSPINKRGRQINRKINHRCTQINTDEFEIKFSILSIINGCFEVGGVSTKSILSTSYSLR